MNVFLTIDTEIWPESWDRLDEEFGAAFRRCIYGPTESGEYGLPFQLRVLQDHGLRASFFVESLFASHFGRTWLAEIVGMVQAADQEVQLHLHPEWVDKGPRPILEGRSGYPLSVYSLEDQKALVGIALDHLRGAGATQVNAFRAGSFGMNRDTLKALAFHDIAFDTSYNPTMFGAQSGLAPGKPLMQPIDILGVVEYPVTAFEDFPGHLRHVQLTAVSFAEMEGALWAALEAQCEAFVIVSHSFELLTTDRARPDPIAVDRFRKLCAFLQKHGNLFRTRGFVGLPRSAPLAVPNLRLKSSLSLTAGRVVEQAARRLFVR